MPRLYDDEARAARDAQLLRLYLAGHSDREMAAQPGLGVSPRGVVKAVRRQSATGLDPGDRIGCLLWRLPGSVRG